MFENHNASIGDNLLSPLIHLKAYAAQRGHTIASTDIIIPENADAIVFIDMPDENNVILQRAIATYKPLYLLALESPLIRPQSFDINKHSYFEKVFTWDDNLIQTNPDKYIKINYSFELPESIDVDLSKKTKLCTTIAGYKHAIHPYELYSKRIEAIRWFEQNHLEDFDLYGIGWDSYRFKGPKVIRALNRIKPLTKLLAPSFPSYKGKVDRKKEVLEKYKFAICYENARDIPGYITEKIFDCFFAGCIPIYWGADNITNYIPHTCFIDQRNFKSYEELYKHIQSMSDTEYKFYLENIETFLKSTQAYLFSNNYFADTILKSFDNE
ncbi:MAG TPA: hypothetical protein DDZ71_09400 [Sulfuricurvum sp.]|nr:hypothetical protein [Sulfuricurvum sp.]